jgi:S-formylglutathione hydrolase FrmB
MRWKYFFSQMLVLPIFFSVSFTVLWVFSPSSSIAQTQGSAYYTGSQLCPGADSMVIYSPSVVKGKLPVVYLLGGFGSSHRSFQKYLNMDSLATAYNIFIVCPHSGKESWYFNHPVSDKIQYEKFFFSKIIPLAETHIKIDTSKRYITGVSMGGHGALLYFIKHNNRFAGAGSSSGVLNLKYSKVRDTSISKILGTYHPTENNYWEHSVNGRVGSLKGCRKPVYIDCGTEDYLLPAAKEFLEIAHKSGFTTVNSTFAPGGHNKDYWKNSVPAQLKYFGELGKK